MLAENLSWLDGSASHDLHFEGHYVSWRRARIRAIIEHYGPDFFRGKTMLELGAGKGDIGAVFYYLGADVTCAEGRQANVDALKKKYPFLKTQLLDLDHDPIVGKYDIVLHSGVLYHLENVRFSLEQACGACEHLILETMVCDGGEGECILVDEPSNYYDQALNGVGSRPSEALLESIMQEIGFSWTKCEETYLDAEIHCYSWERKRSGYFNRPGDYDRSIRALWFAHNPSSFFEQLRKWSDEDGLPVSLTVENGRINGTSITQSSFDHLYNLVALNDFKNVFCRTPGLGVASLALGFACAQTEAKLTATAATMAADTNLVASKVGLLPICKPIASPSQALSWAEPESIDLAFIEAATEGELAECVRQTLPYLRNGGRLCVRSSSRTVQEPGLELLESTDELEVYTFIRKNQ